MLFNQSMDIKIAVNETKTSEEYLIPSEIITGILFADNVVHVHTFQQGDRDVRTHVFLLENLTILPKIGTHNGTDVYVGDLVVNTKNIGMGGVGYVYYDEDTFQYNVNFVGSHLKPLVEVLKNKNYEIVGSVYDKWPGWFDEFD